MKKTTLAIQSFGRENEYRRAVLTVLSFYAQATAPMAETRVILFTDKPEWFQPYFEGLPVEYILLTPEKIKTMRGKIDFLHRMKIALIEEAFEKSDGNLLYADSDTFFVADPMPLAAQLSEAQCFMHLMEYPFTEASEDKTETYRSFLKLINSQSFSLANGEQFTVTPQHCSWNAGIMFFHPSHARVIPDVYTLTDQFYPGSGSHASEQYAFSLMLQRGTGIKPCESVIYHYWYRVKKQIVDQFLDEKLDSAFAAAALPEKLGLVKNWAAMLPGYFENHEWTIRDHAIQAFNINKFAKGYGWTFKALVKKPFTSGPFLKDTIYHIKRQLTGK